MTSYMENFAVAANCRRICDRIFNQEYRAGDWVRTLITYILVRADFPANIRTIL